MNTIFLKSFGMTRLGNEPQVYRLRSELSNYYVIAPVKYLNVGMPINNFHKLPFSENFLHATEEVQAFLNIWFSRGFTLLGKISVLISLVKAKVVSQSNLFTCNIAREF